MTDQPKPRRARRQPKRIAENLQDEDTDALAKSGHSDGSDHNLRLQDLPDPPIKAAVTKLLLHFHETGDFSLWCPWRQAFLRY